MLVAVVRENRNDNQYHLLSAYHLPGVESHIDARYCVQSSQSLMEKVVLSHFTDEKSEA